ncbi:MAG: DinB family protein [Thermomicrobiales bacterium]|nr:DinB family protein [Thermomicrobiales bacterium]
MDLIDRLLGHDRWATETLFDVCGGLSDAQLDQPFDIGLQTLRATFAHIIINIEFWTGLMVGQPVDYVPPSDQPLAALVARHDRAFTAFANLSRRLRDEGRLDDTYIDHYEVRKSMAGTILHVALHNAEHRGEAVHILARLGLPDVEVDHGLWDCEQLNA